MENKNSEKKNIAQNREARHRFEILETIEAGIVLKGTEAKSVRAGKVTMKDAYVFIKSGEAFLSNMHIDEYEHGNRENHNPTRERKLLLNKKEIVQISIAIHEQGRTAVPLSMYYVKGNAKILLGIGRGKKLHDKRGAEKERDSKKELAKITKYSKLGRK